MKVTIDEDTCVKHGMGVEEVLIVMLVKMGVNIPEELHNLLSKEVLVRKDEIFDQYLVTQRWNEIVETIILDSDIDSQPVDRLEALSIELQKIFPAGKKEGTTQYWRGNKREISLRLKKFFKLYGNTYTDEQILNAAKSYVEGFNSRYSYMRVLKYFIWKDEKKLHEDGETKIIEVSELANYIENADQTDDLKEEWTSILN